MHNEQVTQQLPPPLPLSYEQDTKSNGFIDFIHPHHHHQQQQQQHQLIEGIDAQQYANFMPHPAYHHGSAEEQFYASGRTSYPPYPYPYALPPYPSLTLDAGH